MVSPKDSSHTQKAADFLSIADDFRLGHLPTESQHPQTVELSRLANTDVTKAITVLKDVDQNILKTATSQNQDLSKLTQAMDRTRQQGGRIFFYGCGATGRLSLSLEFLWRFVHHDHGEDNTIRGLMSGGDLALVHSIEDFEDHADWGARQIDEAGFKDGDLCVGITEGGETPSVIGATQRAAEISGINPYFLYCNPDSSLENIARSKDVLDNENINKIYCDTGPMALSGSTRMQASTIQMLLAGAALFGLTANDLQHFHDFVTDADFSFLEDFIIREAQIYQDGDFVLYETDDYAITVLTDTTERAPTFSLQGFENQNDPQRKASLSYLRLPAAENAAEAWEKILRRKPEALEWDSLNGTASHSRLIGFDFSQAALAQREKLVSPAKMERFQISKDNNHIRFKLGDLEHDIDLSALGHPLFEHLFLKMIMNIHSTLVMGRLGRFESNVMTWVKPSNNKLIDRAIRYVDHLLGQDGIEIDYDTICHQLFDDIETLEDGEAIVLKTKRNLEKTL